jgi:hypothetical protein
MNGSRRRRSIGKVDMLPDEYKTAVQEMLLSNRVSYRKICEYLAENGHVMSQMAISNYARKYLDQMQMVNIAQENLRMMSEMMERYPELDTTEALIRLSSQQALNTLSEMPEEKWQEMDAEGLMRQINSLVRAAAYKARIDNQNQSEYDRGLEAIKEIFFSSMAKDQPGLYRQVSAYINQQKQDAGEGGTV